MTAMACGRRTISMRVIAFCSDPLAEAPLGEESSGSGTSCSSSAVSASSKPSSSIKSASRISPSRTSSSSMSAFLSALAEDLSALSTFGKGTFSIVSSSSRESMTGSSSVSSSASSPPSMSASSSVSDSETGSSSAVVWNVDVSSSKTSMPKVSLSTPASSKRVSNSAFLPLAERSFRTQSALSFATVRLVVGSSPMVLPHQTVGLIPFKAGVVLLAFCIKSKACEALQPSWGT